MSRSRRVLAGGALAASLCILPGRGARAADPAATDPDLVTLRGTVVCLDAVPATVQDPESDPCNQEGARFELHGSPVGAELASAPPRSETLRFLADDPRALIFLDPVVRERDLEIRGWRRPGGALELLSVYSIVDGRAHHLHYRCDVCNITTSAPGPCWCCGAPFELREEPVDPPSPVDAERDPR